MFRVELFRKTEAEKNNSKFETNLNERKFGESSEKVRRKFEIMR